MPAGDRDGGASPSTVLFVHGAHHAGWCWLLVMDQLATAGIDSQAVDLPFTSFADDVRCVDAAVAAARPRGPVHVVCHSYAGIPVSAGGHAATHLTFVAGRLPLPGEPPAAVTPEWSFAEFQSCMVPGEDGAIRLSSRAERYLFHRSPPALARMAMDRMRPMTSTVPAEPLADPAWCSVPSSYVVCGDDLAARPETQRRLAGRVGASVELDSDHSPFFSAPEALAAFVAERHRAEVAVP